MFRVTQPRSGQSETFEPPSHPHPTPIPRPGLTLQVPEQQVVDWYMVSFCLLGIFFIPLGGQEILWGYRSPRRISGVPGHCRLLLLEEYNCSSLCLCVLRTGAPHCTTLGRCVLIFGSFSLEQSQETRLVAEKSLVSESK